MFNISITRCDNKGDFMKNNKLKQLVASSFVAMFATGCSTAPAPWANGQQGNNAKNGIAHSHNGVVHSHPLPSAGIHHSHRQGGAPAKGSSTNNNGVQHNHQGTTHTHPLPSSGINHSHSGSASAAGGSGSSGSQTKTSAYDYGNYDYGNSTTDTAKKSDSGYYDDEYSRSSDQNNNSRDEYRYDDTSYGGSGGTSSTDNRDYGTNNDSSSGSSSSNSGDYYTVKSKDTVFEVMRQTGAYWKDIIRLNDLKAPKYEIQPGQRLKLPKERNS